MYSRKGQKVDFRKILKFYKGKRVLITGNTGFKGSWLTYIMLSTGAKVTGYALKPHTEPSLFNILSMGADSNLTQFYSDVRDLNTIRRVFNETAPEIVFHLAAQPIVRESYRNPVDTYSTNVMGTVNICECIRLSKSVVSFLNVTTDKVYKNNEWEWGYRENDELNGYDPYSNSKSCSELVTQSYKESFFRDCGVAISTARAGNVIGGGDFSEDRIIPDCVRALSMASQNSRRKSTVVVRNPYSIRPYEHVLEPLFAYMMIVASQYEDIKWSGYYNVGPDDCDCVNTGDLVTIFSEKWNLAANTLPRLSWDSREEKNAPHEANFLKLDCSKLKATFGWQPRWHIDEAIDNTAAWTKTWLKGGDVKTEMDREIEMYIGKG